MTDHLPVCDACQVRPASVVHGCVELCSVCALAELERTRFPIVEDRLRRDLRELSVADYPVLELTADELLREHGIALAADRADELGCDEVRRAEAVR